MDSLFVATQRIFTMPLFAAFLAHGFTLRRTAMLAHRVEQIRAGTAQLPSGELEAELPVDGRDEIAKLAKDFNCMAHTLALAATPERAMEQAGRDLNVAVSHDL